MARTLAILALAMVAYLAVPTAGSAQSMPPPPGSWRDSCVDGRWDGLIFQARCLRMNQRTLLSRINMQGYGGWVTNCDGRLTAAPDCRNHRQQGNFPSGSWRETCADPFWDGRIIRATCQMSDGRWRQTNFDTNWPFYDLSNCNGELTGSTSCGDASLDGLPPGNWRNHCREARVENGALFATCIHNGEWGPRALNIRGHDGPVSYCDGVISRLPSCP